jgi:hypothetical protein
VFGRFLRVLLGRPAKLSDVAPGFSAEAASHSVVLRLDPSAMENPDVDVRQAIEKHLHTAHPDLSFFDDGYGFARSSDAMLLSYGTSAPERLVDALVGMLEHETIGGNHLAAAAIVAVAEREPIAESGRELEHHRIAYPPGQAGQPVPD